MSIEELANRVGIAKSTQSRYENEQRDFPINDIGLYANALNTTIEYLLGIGAEAKGKHYEPETIAAHHDGEEWTAEELEEIEEFKEFVRMKRKKKGE